MLTAAVRDFVTAHGNRFEVDVRTPCPDLWENNPYLTPLEEDDPSVESIEMGYPLIHQSNELPYHFIHAFRLFLEDRLDLKIPAGPFKGDIHLSEEEKGWIGQVEEVTGKNEPFWIINAGGKEDFTCKLWPAERYQKVVNGMRKKGMMCVQIGEIAEGHNHPDLKGVIDLRGMTSLRELIRLVYHSSGIIGPVSLSMHLAAAVECRPDKYPGIRPCVVIAGGREPAHWEQYPGHQFLHTVGRLICCANGGCWRSRVMPLGDGDPKDKEGLCAQTVPAESGKGVVPRCLNAIKVHHVLEAFSSLGDFDK